MKRHGETSQLNLRPGEFPVKPIVGDAMIRHLKGTFARTYYGVG